jgi:hypothetical protein
MTVTNGYCSVADLRGHLGDTGTALNVTLLERAINATSRAIEKHCGGRRFWQDPTPVARRYAPDDPTIAWVDDISTTTGLIVATDSLGDGTYATTWASADYELEPTNAAEDGWPWWRIATTGAFLFPTGRARPGLRVTARFGWAAVPDDVTEAALIRAASLFKRREAPFGVAGMGEFGVVRISRQGDPDVVDLLHPYVRLDVVGV